MPTSAVASGCIDFVLSPEAIPEAIREINSRGLSERPIRHL
ncbi:hypothetical protein [Lichenicola cladoniae]